MVGTSLGLGFPLVWFWVRSMVGLSPLVVVILSHMKSYESLHFMALFQD